MGKVKGTSIMTDCFFYGTMIDGQGKLTYDYDKVMISKRTTQIIQEESYHE